MEMIRAPRGICSRAAGEGSRCHRRTHGVRGRSPQRHEGKGSREHVVANITMGAHDHFFGVVKRPRLAEDFVGDSHFADVVKKSGASQHGEIREGNGNVLGNGNGVGGDALGMAGGFRFFKVQSAAKGFEGVVVRLRQKIQGVGQLSSFLFQFIHDDVPRKHHYMAGLDPLGRNQVVTSLWKPHDHAKLPMRA
jgi:hypothetical protein